MLDKESHPADFYIFNWILKQVLDDAILIISDYDIHYNFNGYMSSIYLIDELLYFPPVDHADENGLLAIGGDLSTDRLLLAYNNAIFPWFEEDQPPLWYSPDPRMVLFFDYLKVSKSMKQVLKKKQFRVTKNKAFQQVVEACASVKRKDQSGTWITEEMKTAYSELHEEGKADSFEVWEGDKLVGGLYGVNLEEKKVFCGESMFSKVSNASKVGFIHMALHFYEKKYKCIDCQVYNDHLASLGAIEMNREDFVTLLMS